MVGWVDVGGGNMGKVAYRLWFVGAGRWVMESDIDMRELDDSDCLSSMVWVYEVDTDWERVRGDLSEGLGYMVEDYGVMGMGLPDIEVVMYMDGDELDRFRWEW